MDRVITKEIRIGDVVIGGGRPIRIQSMTNTKTQDAAATIAQIRRLEEAGCEIIRCAVPDEAAAKALGEIRREISIPLVADIHFDYRLAIAAMEAGADKVRINPGNIGNIERVKAVVDAARERQIPLRVGVNSGSLKKSILKKYGKVTAEGLAESAWDEVRTIEDLGYDQLVVSVKATDVSMNLAAHRLLVEEYGCRYPFHVGITEAGTVLSGAVKSAVGLTMLLTEGIGDTLRVSLSGDPVEEIRTARNILGTLGLRERGPEVISCPTCGRTKVDVIGMASRVEAAVAGLRSNIKIAVMGCLVNGPGEAREADIGIAGGKGEGVLIRRGEVIGKYPEEQLVPALLAEIERMEEEAN